MRMYLPMRIDVNIRIIRHMSDIARYMYADNADIDADIRIHMAIPNIHPCSRNTQQADENSHDAWLHLGPAAAAGISISFSRLKLMKSVAGAASKLKLMKSAATA